jgi:hypothetical protein
MNDFEKNMTQYWTGDFPNWSFLWSKEEAQQISAEHKDQIHFLNEEGTTYIRKLLSAINMSGNLPFNSPFKDYFKAVEEFTLTENCGERIKKWLYDKGIPFSKYVFVDNDKSGQGVMLTWKMVIKYWEGLFHSEDIMIFDSSFEWGIFYYHESQLYFGKDKIFDGEAESKRIMDNKLLLEEWKKAISK